MCNTAVPIPHQWLPLVPHEPERDLAGLPEEALGAHGPHGMHHVLGQPERDHLRHVKRLSLVGGGGGGGWKRREGEWSGVGSRGGDREGGRGERVGGRGKWSGGERVEWGGRERESENIGGGKRQRWG